MDFSHLKCQICGKHFCCIVHRIDHENKNHMKPILPGGKQPSQLPQQKSLVYNIPTQMSLTRNFKSKILIKQPTLHQAQNKTLLNNEFGVLTTSLIYLQNITYQNCIQMSQFIDKPLQAQSDDSNISLTVVKKFGNDSASISCNNECQNSIYLYRNSELSTTEKQTNVKSGVQNSVTAEIQCNIRKRSYNSIFCRSESLVKNLNSSPGNKIRRILLPVRRNKLKSQLYAGVNIVEIKSKRIQNYSPVISEVSTTSSNLVSPVNENDPGNSLKTSTPIMCEPGGLQLQQSDNKLDPNVDSSKIKSAQNYSPAMSEIYTISNNLISPVNENDSDNSLKASTPIESQPEGLDSSPNVHNNLSDSALSFYQTPFGRDTIVEQQVFGSKGKNLAVVTPLRGIILKTPKFKTNQSDSLLDNNSPKPRRVTFYENANKINTKPLESVQEVDFEEDSVQCIEELVAGNCSGAMRKCNELISHERKGLFNTVAGIVSSAIHGFPSLVKSSWEWGQEVHDFSKPSLGMKRLLTPDKQQDLLSRSPVPKRLCYRRNLLASPIRVQLDTRLDQSTTVSSNEEKNDLPSNDNIQQHLKLDTEEIRDDLLYIVEEKTSSEASLFAISLTVILTLIHNFRE